MTSLQLRDFVHWGAKNIPLVDLILQEHFQLQKVSYMPDAFVALPGPLSFKMSD